VKRIRVSFLVKVNRVPSTSNMSSTTDLLAKAEALKTDNPKGREDIYKQILETSKSTVDPDGLRDQETALVKLGELYRDQK
jgi:26S proteasome regulatory subunit N6